MTNALFAVDPDVWRAGQDNPGCRWALWEVWENPENHHRYSVALDGQDVEAEYVEILSSPSTAIDLKKVLQDILNQRDRSPRIQIVRPYLPDDLRQLLERHGCNTPVEPALVAMAASPGSTMITLLLTGADVPRYRGLRHKRVAVSIRRFLRNNLHKGFEVTCIADTRMLHRDQDLEQYRRRVFEDQIRCFMQQRIYHQYGMTPVAERPTPIPILDRAGEIDAYLVLDLPKERLVWIGECELREEGNEGTGTTWKKINKLARKIDAVTSYETAKEGAKVTVRGYMVTNASRPSSAAARLINDRHIAFVPVHMPENWTQNHHWELTDRDVGYMSL